MLALVVGGVRVAWAATVPTLTPIDADYTFIADNAFTTNDWSTGNVTIDSQVFIIKTGHATNKGTSTIDGTAYSNCIQLKPTRDVVFQVASPCTLTIYGQVNGTRYFCLGTSASASGSPAEDLTKFATEGGVYTYEITADNVNKNLYLSSSSDLYLAGFTLTFPVADQSTCADLATLTYDGTAVPGFSANTTEYNVELPLGTTTIPTVAATTKVSGATATVTQATALPGTATVAVTAQDGTTQKTYTIHFTVKTANSLARLLSVKLSNGFDAFIDHSAHTITGYYLGSEAPTVANVTFNDASTGATWLQATNTARAEDGTETQYTLNLSPVEPYNGIGHYATGDEVWAKGGGGFYNQDAKYGWRIAKNTEEDASPRVSAGQNRLYFFLDGAKTITLRSGKGGGKRNLDVYIDGVKAAQQATLPAYTEAGATVTIDINKAEPCIVGITNMGSGDGIIDQITITRDAPAITTLTLNANGFATYSNNIAVELTGAEAYKGTITNSTLALTKVGTTVPAGAGVLLYGQPGATVTVAAATTEPEALTDNDLRPVLIEQAPEENTYVLNGNEFKHFTGASLAPYKAYVIYTSASGAKLSIAFDDETNHINNITATRAAGHEAHNIIGQRVAPTAKGIVIINGKKHLNK